MKINKESLANYIAEESNHGRIPFYSNLESLGNAFNKSIPSGGLTVFDAHFGLSDGNYAPYPYFCIYHDDQHIWGCQYYNNSWRYGDVGYSQNPPSPKISNLRLTLLKELPSTLINWLSDNDEMDPNDVKVIDWCRSKLPDLIRSNF